MLMRLQKLKKNQHGFTLIELLVVIGILAILLAITLIALNPTKHFQGARNAQRSSDVTAILDGIYQYEAAHTGTLPPSVSSVTTAVHLGLGGGKIDTCSDLVPTYLADLPRDPGSNSSVTGGSTPCGAGTTAY